MQIVKTFFLFLIFLFSDAVFAQQYTGVVYNSYTGAELPYVNIGIVGKGVGTVSLGNGSFKIPLDEVYDNDTLRFSMIGFQTVDYLIADFKKEFGLADIKIYLVESVTELQTVEIKPLLLVSIIKGNTFNNKGFAAGWKSDDLGGELGTIMNVKSGKTYYLKNVQVNIAWCKYDSILFRMNIYNYSGGKPDSLLHSLPIYLKIRKEQRYLYLDLQEYNISVTGDFLVALEWLDDFPDKPSSLMFCAGLMGASTCYRKTSQDVWNKIPIGIGCSVELEYAKE